MVKSDGLTWKIYFGEYMQATQLLDATLAQLDAAGSKSAYQYLVSHLDQLEEMSGQVYNFLYCLAATSGHPEAALNWMETAVVEKGFWYRPEVFDDEDLDSIRGSKRFAKYTQLSTQKYLDALERVETVCTWEKKSADNLIVVLHGNQQNNAMSRTYWQNLSAADYQIEYLQSHEIDSYQLFRWEANGDGPIQLEKAVAAINWDTYGSTTLAGFSAGCNTILRALTESKVRCDRVVMQPPWIPSLENNIDKKIKALIKKEIEVLLICGRKDADCLPLSTLFASKAHELGLQCTPVFIDGLGHDYPDTFKTVVEKFLT